MGVVKSALDEIKTVADELEAEGHKLAATLKVWLEKLAAHLPEAEAEAKADAEQVAKDAVAAEAPVVNKAVQDVAAVGEAAVVGDGAAPTSEAANS